MTCIVAIDPGLRQSAWVLYDLERSIPEAFGKEDNAKVLQRIYASSYDCGYRYPETIALEMVASYGLAVGQSIFETVLWIGRFYEAAAQAVGQPQFIYRKDIKLHLCNNMRAKDANVRQAVLDRYGGKENAIGTKKTGYGPLHGITADVWSALAIAIVWAETPPAEVGIDIAKLTN